MFLGQINSYCMAFVLCCLASGLVANTKEAINNSIAEVTARIFASLKGIEPSFGCEGVIHRGQR